MHLSKKELEIMEIIWNSKEPISSSDILENHPNLNRNTVLVSLKKLLNNGYLSINKVELKSKVLMRYYVPEISKYDYDRSNIGEDRVFNFVAKFVSNDITDSEIEELEKLIQEKKKSA
ncbi:BlaI/MecI/CopY family transcriptional regulator [Allobaculum stercoricanis]|uniref:BlaI/MecI/CopY family transcriptional regulator n=1 Tax=Allobaculum stercoricanis TaxID=174709 RepID=UPI00035E1D94|nr:BlaI/MecI/CopY family transcriptional regulator [Allobaculum stercoricanis]